MEGEAPIALSSRDGRLIKPVPEGTRLDEEALMQNLTGVLQDFLQKEAQRLLYVAWAKGEESLSLSLSTSLSTSLCHRKWGSP
jgi:hypothetical protein